MRSGGDIASDTWADQLRFPPWIEDGHGVLFNEAFFKARNDCGRQLPDGAGLAPVPDLHSTASSSERPHDHGA